MIKKNKLFLFLAVCAALCVPIHAEDSGLSMDDAMSIILSHHGVVTDSFVAYILWPEEMAANAPTVYRHIETCLHEMKSDLE